MAPRFTPRRIQAGIITLIASVCYAMGLILPMATVSRQFKPFIDQTEVYSLPSAIRQLYEQGEYILVAILVAFTFIFPATKLFSLFMGVFAGWTDETRPMYRWMRATGRWSMLDVFVVAILVVLMRIKAMGGGVTMTPEIGIYLFGASVILAIWAGHWAEAANRTVVASLAAFVMLGSVGCGGDTVQPSGATPLEIVAEGFPPMVIPVNNPTTVEGVALGRRLFHDRLLSGDHTQSCADCHNQAQAFTDNGRRFSVGIDGIEGPRNAPAIINLGWAPSQFWDGRASTLEAQAIEPVPNPIEMHLPWETALTRLAADPDYPGMFRAAFGEGPITQERTVMAIAQFERTLVSNNSRFDRVRRGEVEFTEAEQRGFDLFFSEKGDCFHCHGIPFFTDQLFRNNGLDRLPADAGRELVTGEWEDRGKFRSPTLRNVEFTAPYMHDGRFATLEEVLDHYNSGAQFSITVDPLIRTGDATLGLSEADMGDIITFLKTLSDSTFLENPDYGPPS